MEDVQISVLCTTYNQDKYIGKTLDSLINQEVDVPFEIIVHDDASTDKTRIIIKEYEKNYPNIIKTIFQEENQYSKGNSIMKYLLPLISGKYIAYCEGDDYWTSPHKLQEQFDYMETHSDCALVVHDAIRVKENGFFFSSYSKIELKSCNLNVNEIIGNLSLFPLNSMFFKSDFYRNNYDFLTTVQLFDYGLKILLATEGYVHYIAKPMSAYRENAKGSWTLRIGRNKELYIRHLIDSIEVLNRINCYRNQTFSKSIECEVLRRKANIYILSNSYFKIIKSEYADLYKQLSIKNKINTFMFKHMPPKIYMYSFCLYKLIK